MFEKLVEIICNYVEVEPEKITPRLPLYGGPGLYLL